MLSEYAKAIESLANDIKQARQRNVKTVVYFVYAGHGNVRDGHGYITLEDARLDGAQLEAEVLTKINADQTHFIVDACYSYFLALGRGPGSPCPGTSRRAVPGSRPGSPCTTHSPAFSRRGPGS